MQKFEPGNHSESIILSTYLKEGFAVIFPFDLDAGYDLYAELKNWIRPARIELATFRFGAEHSIH